MRRSELIEAIDQVSHAVAMSNAHDTIRSIIDSTRRAADPSSATGKTVTADILRKVVETNRIYTIESQHFNPTAHKIVKILEIPEIGQTDFWVNIISTSSDVIGRRLLFDITEKLTFAVDYLPQIIKLLKLEEPPHDDQSILSIILPEDENQLSRPTRVVNVLEGIQAIYEVCASINNLPPEDISVLSLDSGSDKSVDFLGAAEVMKCVRELINDLWDKIIFFRERQTSARIDLINQSLPAIDEIGRLEQEGKLGPEQAELLRRKLIDGTTKFLGTGAITPELEQRSTFNPRILMQPEPKLLTTTAPVLPPDTHDKPTRPSETDTEQEPTYTIDNTQDSISTDTLSDSELELLKKLIEKAQGKRTENGMDNRRPIDPYDEYTSPIQEN